MTRAQIVTPCIVSRASIGKPGTPSSSCGRTGTSTCQSPARPSTSMATRRILWASGAITVP
jgi:hypothetical protein